MYSHKKIEITNIEENISKNLFDRHSQEHLAYSDEAERPSKHLISGKRKDSLCSWAERPWTRSLQSVGRHFPPLSGCVQVLLYDLLHSTFPSEGFNLEWHKLTEHSPWSVLLTQYTTEPCWVVIQGLCSFPFVNALRPSALSYSSGKSQHRSLQAGGTHCMFI